MAAKKKKKTAKKATPVLVLAVGKMGMLLERATVAHEKQADAHERIAKILEGFELTPSAFVGIAEGMTTLGEAMRGVQHNYNDEREHAHSAGPAPK
jgi:hypothetical protein